MTPVVPLPKWYRDLRASVVDNRRSSTFIRPFLLPYSQGADVSQFIAQANEIVRSLPYRFDGDLHHAYPWRQAVARGHAACMDAAAFMLALASLVDRDAASDTALCYETSTADPSYAHVRVYWRGLVADPYPEFRRPVDACTASATLGAMLDPIRYPTSLQIVGDVCHSCNNVRA